MAGHFSEAVRYYNEESKRTEIIHTYHLDDENEGNQGDLNDLKLAATTFPPDATIEISWGQIEARWWEDATAEDLKEHKKRIKQERRSRAQYYINQLNNLDEKVRAKVLKGLEE